MAINPSFKSPSRRGFLDMAEAIQNSPGVRRVLRARLAFALLALLISNPSAANPVAPATATNGLTKSGEAGDCLQLDSMPDLSGNLNLRNACGYTVNYADCFVEPNQMAKLGVATCSFSRLGYYERMFLTSRQTWSYGRTGTFKALAVFGCRDPAKPKDVRWNGRALTGDCDDPQEQQANAEAKKKPAEADSSSKASSTSADKNSLRYWLGGEVDTSDYVCDAAFCALVTFQITLQVSDDRYGVLRPVYSSGGQGKFFIGQHLESGLDWKAEITEQDPNGNYRCEISGPKQGITPADESALNINTPKTIIRVLCQMTDLGRVRVEEARKAREETAKLSPPEGTPLRRGHSMEAAEMLRGAVTEVDKERKALEQQLATAQAERDRIAAAIEAEARAKAKAVEQARTAETSKQNSSQAGTRSSWQRSVCKRNLDKINQIMKERRVESFFPNYSPFLIENSRVMIRLMMPCADSDSTARSWVEASTLLIDTATKHCQLNRCLPYGYQAGTKEEQTNRLHHQAFQQLVQMALTDPNWSSDLDRNADLGSRTSSEAVSRNAVCAKGLDAVNREVDAINRRRPANPDRLPDLQTMMYATQLVVRHLETQCAGQPEAGQLREYRQVFTQTQQTCRAMATSPEACAPKLNW